MSQELSVRPAEAHDGPALGRLGASLVAAHHAVDPARFLRPTEDTEGGYAWFLGSLRDSPDSIVYVAERAGAVVGYVYAGIEPKSWMELRESAGFIHDVVVEPDEQNAGVGTRLVEAAIAWLEERGAPRVMLWSAAGNPGAQRLFERLGFRRTMVEMTRERSAPAGDARRSEVDEAPGARLERELDEGAEARRHEP